MNGVKLCNTLEDTDRGLTKWMPFEELKRKKVYGRTAIPTGTYKVRSYWWAKHGNYYPLLEDVPGYTGILIHGGVTEEDTLGCILVGENRATGKLTNSARYVRELTKKIQECEKRGEVVTITIE